MTEEQKQILKVWELFKKVRGTYKTPVPELRLFSDGSGSILDLMGNSILEWVDLDDAEIKLTNFLNDETPHN